MDGLLNFALFSFVFGIFMFHTSDVKCGIPVKEWLIVYLSIFFGNIIFKMVGILIVRFRLQSRAAFSIILMLVYNLLIFGWLIYGNYIYFSPENTCTMN